eukprot:927367-Pleurochrysis_carterae.AAC.2
MEEAVKRQVNRNFGGVGAGDGDDEGEVAAMRCKRRRQQAMAATTVTSETLKNERRSGDGDLGS